MKSCLTLSYLQFHFYCGWKCKKLSKLHIRPPFFLCYYKMQWDCRHKIELLLFPSINKQFWFLYSVNIKAESPDPTSSWRSLIPVIKVNISTVSTSENQQENVLNLVRQLSESSLEEQEIIRLCSFVLLHVRLLSCRVVWRLGTITSPRLCVWTLRMPSWRTPQSLHQATWTSTCTLLKVHWRMCASCLFPVHVTWACRMMSK